MITSEHESVATTADSDEPVRSGESLQSDLEQIAARIFEHLPKRSINKLIDQLENKVMENKISFDHDEIQDAIEIATFIKNHSSNEQVLAIAADIRELGKDYEKYQQHSGFSLEKIELGAKLLGEVETLKKDTRGLTPWTIVKMTWGVFCSIVDKIILWTTSKIFGYLLALFLCFPKQQRMSHNNGIAARGTFSVVPNPKFPPSDFFLPGRVFPLRIRHASATFLDDAMNCIRSISVKLADTQYQSPFDLQMNTGATSLFWSATSFWKFAVLRKEKYGIEYRDFNRKYPEGLEASKIATRRQTPFDRLYYYCKTPFLYHSTDGEKYYAKYRVIPYDKAKDAGIKTDRSDWDECNQRVKDHDQHGRNFLKYAYEDLVSNEGKVRYWLQIQTRLASDAENDPEICNNMVEWDEEWHDLGVMEVTETLDWRESTLTSFTVNNMPKGLGVIPAKSVFDYNSVNYMRSHAEIAYKARMWSYKVFGMVPPIPDNDNRNVSDWGE